MYFNDIYSSPSTPSRFTPTPFPPNFAFGFGVGSVVCLFVLSIQGSLWRPSALRCEACHGVWPTTTHQRNLTTAIDGQQLLAPFMPRPHF